MDAIAILDFGSQYAQLIARACGAICSDFSLGRSAGAGTCLEPQVSSCPAAPSIYGGAPGFDLTRGG
jgi:hypothetical protein